ncbi:MFS transporter [Pseudarthrobacter oxydans]|uniref:MFS transporter n=1 Tax=Pseudarthrobacter oxydans TaxID=1671 RepID=UPI003D2A339B
MARSADLLDQSGPPVLKRPRTTLAVSLLGFFVITLDALMVNVALSTIEKQLGGGILGQQWVVNSYTLMFASLMLFAGNFSDRIGAKRAFRFGLVIFVLASAACSLSPELIFLVSSRLLQGSAAALLLPSSLALIREAFPDAQGRAKAIGVWSLGGAVSAATGPALGGLLATVDWRLVFLINVPVGAVALLLLARAAPSPTRPTPFDWAGQVTAIAGIGGLTYGIIEGGSAGFGSLPVIIAFALAAVGLTAFLLIQARGSHPVLPLHLFRSRVLRLALIIGFASTLGWYGMVFVVSLFLQQHMGLSPLVAGLAFIPTSVLIAVSNIAAGRAAARFGPRVPAAAGQLIMAIGLVAMLATAPLESLLLVTILMIPVGVGGALTLPSVTALVLDSVPAARAGAASAVFNTFRQLGGAIGIAVFGALLTSPDVFVSGAQTSLLIAAVLVLFSAVTSLFVRPSVPPHAPAEK